MPKARSYKNEPWLGFEKQSYSLFTDDFVHKNLLTVKANIESPTGGANLKESLSQKEGKLTSTGQSKLWFYFKDTRSLYAKILPHDFTLTYDHGSVQNGDKVWNVYGGLDTNRHLNNNTWRLGAEVFGKNSLWSCSNLLQFNQGTSDLSWHHKGYSTKNNWFLNAYHTLNITGRAFQTAAFLVAYKQIAERNTDWSLRFELNRFANLTDLKKSLCEDNKLTLSWVNYQKGKCVHGLEFTSSLNKLLLPPNAQLKNLTAAFESNLPESNAVAKLKVSGNWTAAFSLKHKIGNYGSYTWGTELSEIGSKNHVKFGVQIDLNL